MMATAEPLSSSSLLPLLESLEDASAGQSDQTDAYLTIANRLSQDDGRQFLPAVEKHFSRLVKTILTHISSPNTELSQASLQALGFCLYHAHVARGVTAKSAEDILTALCSLVVKSTDKNTCIRALWVISKQNFPQQVVANKVASILGTLENVWTREDIQSVVMEHEALNVIIRMLEQAPVQMGQSAVRWSKLILPLVVHSASKVRLRAAAALELGLPLLLEKQNEVACILEPLMSSKLIPELQKLFISKNEANVLKLWPLFVKLLGKLLHKGGPFINSVLHLEEMGFRHSSPTIKKIAFIAWKSLIDNFALNPDILSNTKRMKLLMQPLNIHLRTEALQLTKVEVWWYLVVRLGPNLGPNFEQVSVPLLQCTIGADATVPGTPVRGSNQSSSVTPVPSKTGGAVSFNSSASSTPRLNVSTSSATGGTYPSIQLLGVEMLLHYFLGAEVVSMAARNKLVLSLEPLTHPFISGISSFTKHAAVFMSNVRDGFIAVGKDAPESLLTLIWKRLVSLVNSTIESVKKDRQACEVLTMMFQALQSIVSSEALPADKVLALFDLTVKGIPQRILGSATYQVGKMDVLNGTPALYLTSLLYNSSLLSAYVEHERFFEVLHALVDCGLAGPTSPLAFTEAVLGAMGRSAGSLENQDHLWRMWSTVVGPLTDTVTQTNEVNQGDALEHNFSAMHCALMFPVTHLLSGKTPTLPQNAQKSMLSMWSKLYKAFARCSALVATAEENVCCEELCKKMASTVDSRAMANPSTLEAVSSILQVIIECVDFSPYTPQFQQRKKSPHTPSHWRSTSKKNKTLGNLYTYQVLLVQCLDAYLALEGPVAAASEQTVGSALVSVVSTLFNNLVLASTVQEALASLNQPLTLFYKQASREVPKFSSWLMPKLVNLLGEVLGCLQSRSALAFGDDLLELLSPLLCVLFPHSSKQLRTSVTHFWNATFAKSLSLHYPEELRPILRQVKLKTPIILPGFEANSLDSDELGGQYSSESSQLETKLSGVKVESSSSAAKRGSLLGRAGAVEQDRTPTRPKPVSQTKLDFGSPRPVLPTFRKDLDEEASVDFVFIPPETKEATTRVLTEHQKEMKRTKRADIPAMYNNLDASLDTTAFSQYTQQSQEEESSMDTLQPDGVDSVAKEAPGSKVHDVEMEEGQPTDVVTEETQEYASEELPDDVATEVAVNEKTTQETSEDLVVPESADVSLEEVDDTSAGAVAAEGSVSANSPNVSGSSDLVSDTPQKSNSRRQSFITLEKYAADSKPTASPALCSSPALGPLTKVSNNNPEATTSAPTSASPAPAATGTDPQVPPLASPAATGTAGTDPQAPPDGTAAGETTQEKSSPVDVPPAVSPKPSEGNLSDKPRTSQGTEDEEDVIPDTQNTETQNVEKKASESDSSLEESQSSQVEPRRSGRVPKPKHPGEDGEKRPSRRSRTGEDSQSQGGSQNATSTDSQSHGTRSRSKQQEIVNSRTRGQKSAVVESSQTDSQQPRTRKRITLYSNSNELLGEDSSQPKRRSSRKHEKGESDTTSSSDGQSQERRRAGRPSKSAVETTEGAAGRPGRRTGDQKDSSQKDSSQKDSSQKDSSQKDSSQKDSSQKDSSQKDSSQKDSSQKDSSQKDSSQVDPHVVTKTKLGEEETEASLNSSQVTTPSEADSQSSQSKTSRRGRLVEALGGLMTAKRRKSTDTGHEPSLDEVFTPSAADSQSQRQSKATSEAAAAAAPQIKDVGSLERDNGSDAHSQSAVPAVGQTTRARGRPSRKNASAALESNNSPSLTPTGTSTKDSSQSLEESGGSGRYSTRRSSSQASLASKENSSEVREDTPPMATKQQSRKSNKDSLPPRSPTRDSSESKVALDVGNGSSQSLKEPSESQNAPSAGILESKSLAGDHLPNSPNVPLSTRPPLVTKNAEEQQRDEGKETTAARTAEVAAIIATKPVVVMEKMETEDKCAAHGRGGLKSKPSVVLSHKSDHRDHSPLKVKLSRNDDASSPESGAVRESQVPDVLLKSGGITSESQSSDLPVPPAQKNSHSDTAAASTDQALLSASPVSTEQCPPSSPSPVSTEQCPPSSPSPVSTEQCPRSSPSPVSTEQCPPSSTSPVSTEQCPPSSTSPVSTEQCPPSSPSPVSMEQCPPSSPSPVSTEQCPPSPTSPVTSGSSPDDDTPITLSGETDNKLSLQVSQSSSEDKDGESARPVEAVTEEDHQAEDLNPPAEDKVEGVDASGGASTTGQPHHLLPECPPPSASSDDLPEEEEEQFTVIKESQSEALQVEGERVVRLHQESEERKDDVPSELQQGPHVEPLGGESAGKDDVQEEVPSEQEEETQIDMGDMDAVGLDAPAVPSASSSTCKEVYQDSPAKQKGLLNGLEAMESPSSRKGTRGTWSPSASPSTSILKKGQKRQMEEETPSPLVKSRRVSFANPIQHQELADDIDRRSPVVRTSSPKRVKTTSSIVNKYVTTPTKGPLLLSPRTLHSPGYKSSKKCLISEMSHEPRPIPKDCVFPALVACSTPVEAVLPQITSNMWPRGFGQLVRARNIKTVGDLSALTPSEIKTLPIRSPKISNVKKALRTYHEQQRKGQGGDELKSFDETEKMTSEPETSGPQNQEEDDKSPGEPLATELLVVEEPGVSEDHLKPNEEQQQQQQHHHRSSVDPMEEERPPTTTDHHHGLSYQGQPVDVGALVSKVIPRELLRRCTDQQLVQLLMSVAREQQARLEQQRGGDV